MLNPLYKPAIPSFLIVSLAILIITDLSMKEPCADELKGF
jgi:hypothetical protein